VPTIVARVRRSVGVVAVFALVAASVCQTQAEQRSVTVSVQAQHLVGTWLHSQEEDSDNETVYRPFDYDFPPARGRTGYEFKADHSGNFLGIASRDGWAKEPCRWELGAGARPEIVLTFADGRRETLSVVSVNAEKLVVRKK
jgi:hypothetical protein